MPVARPGADLRRRWLLAPLVLFVPKCFACVLAYAGVAGALGLAGPELCGAPRPGLGAADVILLALGLVGAGLFLRRRRP